MSCQQPTPGAARACWRRTVEPWLLFVGCYLLLLEYCCCCWLDDMIRSSCRRYSQLQYRNNQFNQSIFNQTTFHSLLPGRPLSLVGAAKLFVVLIFIICCLLSLLIACHETESDVTALPCLQKKKSQEQVFSQTTKMWGGGRQKRKKVLSIFCVDLNKGIRTFDVYG